MWWRCRAAQLYIARRINKPPGSRENQTSGFAHQIWRATSTIASAPPSKTPSRVIRRTSRRRSSGATPRCCSRSRTSGSCSGRATIPHLDMLRWKQLTNVVQSAHWPSYKSHGPCSAGTRKTPLRRFKSQKHLRTSIPAEKFRASILSCSGCDVQLISLCGRWSCSSNGSLWNVYRSCVKFSSPLALLLYNDTRCSEMRASSRERMQAERQ